ncbi:MAG: hypothetical protein HY917_00250, partial [Candidatus Diapherotrites archaeon]|nr:hypothetical protein [Candidatus Diapherotrites archaeon]
MAKRVPLPIIQKAWKTRKKHQTYNHMLVPGVVQQYHTERHPKIMLALREYKIEPEEYLIGGHWIRVTAFPKPDKFSEFERTAKGPRSRGPAQDNPNGIGTVAFRINQKTNTAELHFA